jgi:hypothetical protein
MADDDRRDERIGAWLETEPLDDVTRRRLVSTAVRDLETAGAVPEREAGRGGHRPSLALRWIATAAALVALLVGGLALLTARGGNDEPRASAPAHTPDGAGGSARSSGGLAEAAAPDAAKAAPVDVGDFGDLSRATNLARLRTALERGLAPAAAPDPTSGGSAADSQTTAGGSTFSTLACRDRLPAGTVTAVARGTLDGRPATVVLTALPDGNRSVDAVLTDPCEVRPLS